MNFKRATRFGLSLFLSLSIAIQAFALPNGNPPPTDGDLPGAEGLPLDPESQKLVPISPLEKLAPYDLVDTTGRYHAAYVEARKRMKALHEDLKTQLGEKAGVAEFNKRLDQNKIIFDIEGYGLVSFTTIDGQPIGRVKHPESGVSFLFLEKSLIEEGSKHLDLYTARQHFDAGADRGQEYYDTNNKLRRLREGRDNVFVWLSDADSSIEKIEQKPRYPKRSRLWWAEWFKATYQKPTGYNWGLGLAAGTAQAFVAAVIGATLTTVAGSFGVGPMTDIMTDEMQTFSSTYGHALQVGAIAAIPSFVFGSVLGVWSRAFSNWRARGSEKIRLLKNTSVSILFYMGVKTVTNGGLFQFNYLTGTQFAANLYLKNALKEPNYGFADLEAAERADQDWVPLSYPTIARNEEGKIGISTKPVKLPSFARDKDGRWQATYKEVPVMKRVDWNRSFKFYLPMNTLTLIDQIWFTWWMSEFLQGDAAWWMPWISTAMLAAGVPLSWKLLMNFAHRKYPDSDKTKHFERISRKYIDAKVIMTNGVAQIHRWKGGMKRLFGFDSQQPEQKHREREEAIPRHTPAFEGQAHEGINWFRPVNELDCNSSLTGKKAI